VKCHSPSVNDPVIVQIGEPGDPLCEIEICTDTPFEERRFLNLHWVSHIVPHARSLNINTSHFYRQKSDREHKERKEEREKEAKMANTATVTDTADTASSKSEASNEKVDTAQTTAETTKAETTETTETQKQPAAAEQSEQPEETEETPEEKEARREAFKKRQQITRDLEALKNHKERVWTSQHTATHWTTPKELREERGGYYTGDVAVHDLGFLCVVSSGPVSVRYFNVKGATASLRPTMYFSKNFIYDPEPVTRTDFTELEGGEGDAESPVQPVKSVAPTFAEIDKSVGVESLFIEDEDDDFNVEISDFDTDEEAAEALERDNHRKYSNLKSVLVSPVSKPQTKPQDSGADTDWDW